MSGDEGGRTVPGRVPVGEAPAASLRAPEPGERPDLWPWTARRREDGVLVIGGCALDAVAEEFHTPVYLLDRADLAGRAQVWVSAMAEEFWEGYGMAGGDAFYAAKALLCADVVDVARFNDLSLIDHNDVVQSLLNLLNEVRRDDEGAGMLRVIGEERSVEDLADHRVHSQVDFVEDGDCRPGG